MISKYLYKSLDYDMTKASEYVYITRCNNSICLRYQRCDK